MKTPALGRHGPNRLGMVLFELIIALFVFVLVAFSLMKMLDVALDMAQERRTVDRVTLGLQNQLALLQATRLVSGGHDLPDDGSGLTYHLTITPEQLQDQLQQPVAHVYRATLTAKWKSDGQTQSDDQTQSRSVSELIFQP